MTVSRQWQLVRRPVGEPVEPDVTLASVPLPDPGPGQVLVRNTWLSVDPYMRNRMNEGKSYVPPFALGAPMTGGAVGVVEQVGGAAADGGGHPLTVGDVVGHDEGWRTHAVLDGAATRWLDTGPAPAQAYLGVLGLPGLTAYAGLVRVAELRPGDRVLVSAAGGAVGSLAGQIAKLKGASLVVGSAGGPEKVRWLTEEAKFDAAIDYKALPLPLGLKRAAPEGIDVYFDNVGGEQLQVAIGNLRKNGRVAICGMISGYNATAPVPGPRNLALAIVNRLTLRGFIVYDHEDLREQFESEMLAWLAARQIAWRETVVDGIEATFGAFTAMMRGENAGKMLVRL
jgi:NADPH-dependent curcumin reductase CurA